jgi:hypothetical protein
MIFIIFQIIVVIVVCVQIRIFFYFEKFVNFIFRQLFIYLFNQIGGNFYFEKFKLILTPV